MGEPLFPETASPACPEEACDAELLPSGPSFGMAVGACGASKKLRGKYAVDMHDQTASFDVLPGSGDHAGPD